MLELPNRQGAPRLGSWTTGPGTSHREDHDFVFEYFLRSPDTHTFYHDAAPKVPE